MPESLIKEYYDEETREKINKYRKWKNLFNFLTFPDSLPASNHYYFSIILAHIVLYFFDFYSQLLSFLNSNFTNPYSVRFSFLLVIALVTFIPNSLIRYLDYRWDKKFELVIVDFPLENLAKSFLLYLIFLSFISLVILNYIMVTFITFLILIILGLFFLVSIILSFTLGLNPIKKLMMYVSKIILKLKIPYEIEKLNNKELKIFVSNLFKDEVNLDIYTVKASRETKKINASYNKYLSNVYLYDNLINKASKTEIKAIIAHELGHYKQHNTKDGILSRICSWKDIYSSIDIIFLSLILLIIIGSFLLLRSFEGETTLSFMPIILPILYLIFMSENISNKHTELDADRFATSVIDNHFHLISGLTKTSKNNLNKYSYNAIEKRLFSDHPSLKSRIDNIKDFEK